MKNLIKLLFALLFFYAAYIQLNDPDPIAWISIYIFAGLLSLISLFKAVHRYPIIAVISVTFIWAMTLFPATVDALGNKNLPVVDSEEAREFFGLLIISAWNLVLLTLTTAKKSLKAD